MTTFNKKIIKSNQDYIINHYETKEDFINEVKHYMTMNDIHSSYQAINRMVEYGCFDVYYNDCRKYLTKLLGQTEEEGNKYNDNQVWKLYKHLLSRDGSKLFATLTK